MQKFLSIVIFQGWVILLSFSGYSQNPQPVCFSYDVNGNRIRRDSCSSHVVEVDSTDSLFYAPNGKLNYLDGDVALKEMFLVFPNPTDDQLFVDVKEHISYEYFTICLFSIYGQKLMCENSCDRHNFIDMSIFLPGSYILVIESGNEKASWKVIRSQ